MLPPISWLVCFVRNQLIVSISWGRQKNNPPKSSMFLSLRTCDYLGLYGKGNFSDMIMYECWDGAHPRPLGGVSLIMQVLESGESFHGRSGMRDKKRGNMHLNMIRTWPTVTGFEDGGRQSPAKKCIWSLEPGNNLELTVSRKTRILVLKLQELNSVNNLNGKGHRFSPTSSKKSHSPASTLILAQRDLLSMNIPLFLDVLTWSMYSCAAEWEVAYF